MISRHKERSESRFIAPFIFTIFILGILCLPVSAEKYSVNGTQYKEIWNGSYIDVNTLLVNITQTLYGYEVKWAGGIYSLYDDGVYNYDLVVNQSDSSIISTNWFTVESQQTTGQKNWQYESITSNDYQLIDDHTIKRIMSLDSGGKFNITYHIGWNIKMDFEVTAGYNRNYRIEIRQDMPAGQRFGTLNNNSKKYTLDDGKNFTVYDWTDIPEYTVNLSTGVYESGYNFSQWIDTNGRKFYQKISIPWKLNISETVIIDPQWSTNGSTTPPWNNTLKNNSINDTSGTGLVIGLFYDSFNDGNCDGWNAYQFSGWDCSVFYLNNTYPLEEDNYIDYDIINISNHSSIGISYDIYWEFLTTSYPYTNMSSISNTSNNIKWYTRASDGLSRIYHQNSTGYLLTSTTSFDPLESIWYNMSLYRNDSFYWIQTMNNLSTTPALEDEPYTNFSYFRLGATYHISYDNIRIYSTNSGNVQTWYNTTVGNETYQIDVNATGGTKTNYSVFYRTNGTGGWTAIGTANATANQSISLSTKYQNTDVKVELYGNSTTTPELTGITFYTQEASAGAPCSGNCYVGKNGSNSNTGNISAPYLTINYSASVAPENTTIWVHDGVYNEKLILNNSSITLRAINKSGAVIDGTSGVGIIVDSNGFGEGLINSVGHNNISIFDFKIINSTSTGIFIKESGTNYADDIHIEGNNISNTSSSAIIVRSGHRVKVYNNTMSDNAHGVIGTDNSQEIISIQGLEGYPGTFVNTFNISWNNITNGDYPTVGGEGIDCKVGCYNGLIHDNYIDGVVSTGIYIDGYGHNTTNISIYNNKVNGTNRIWGYGIAVGAENGGNVSDIRVYNNLITNNNYSGIAVPASNETITARNISICYNTVVNNGLSSATFGGIDLNLWSDYPTLENITVCNNILDGNQDGSIIINSINTSVNITNNLIDNFQSWSYATYTETLGNNSTQSDPGFVSSTNYSLIQNSAAMDLGTIFYAPTFDIDYTARPNGGYDIGAYESGTLVYGSIEAPTITGNTTGNFWVNWSYLAGANSSSIEVYVNNSLVQNSSAIYYNYTASAHENVSLGIRGYNSSSGNYSNFTNESVIIPNNIPTIVGINANYIVNESETLNINASCADDDSDGCLWEQNMSGANINSQGNWSWTPTFSQAGNYSVQISVNDTYSTNTTNFTIQVIDMPIPTPPTITGNTTGNFWVNWTYSAGEYTTSVLVYINDVLVQNSSTLHYNFSASAHQNLSIGLMGYNATTGNYTSSVNESVSIPNNAPVLSGINASYSMNESTTLNINVGCTDVDSDPCEFTTNLTGAFIDGTGAWSWSPGYWQAGVYSVSVTANDGFSGSDTEIFGITVVDVPYTGYVPIPSYNELCIQSGRNYSCWWSTS